jgi:hypothetical protein
LVESTLLIAVGVSIFYVLLGGLVALGTLRTLPSYGYGTQIFLLPPDTKQRILAESLARQETINIVRQIRNEVSFQLLRNGFVFFMISIFIYIVSVALGNATDCG